MKLSDTSKPGVPLAQVPILQFPVLMDSRRGEPLFLASAQDRAGGLAQETAADLTRFNLAITAGRLLPGETGNAFQDLPALKAELSPERYIELQNQLRVALENKAQEVLLRYLAGDQN